MVLEKYVDPTGRMDERPVRYLYADGWLTEADFRERTLQRRQLARPGEAYDPLKPGEGPVPLPIGQRADEVRSRFRVVLAGAPAHPALAAMRDGKRPLVGLVLEPRPGMADRDLRSATVWYDARTLAPCGVEAMRAPSRPLTSTIIEVLDIPNACVAASTQTLAGRRGMGVAVIGLYNGTAPAGYKLNAAGARTRAMVNTTKGTRRSWRSSRD